MIASIAKSIDPIG